MAAKKQTGTAVVAWEAEMAAKALVAAAAEKAWGSYKSISTQGGIMKVDDEPVEDNKLSCVVLSFIHENQYYDQPFNPRVMTPPKCYAYSDPTEADQEAAVAAMAPHEKAEMKQGFGPEDEQGGEGASCSTCWANQMGTADTGRGKACKNIRKLALVTPDALESAEAMAQAEVRFLKVPVMSTKGWGKYVRTLSEDMQRPPYGVVTTISVVPDADSQFFIEFEFEELVQFDQELWEAMQKKIAEINPALVIPYPSAEELAAQQAAKPARPGKPGAKGKPTPKGKAAAKPAPKAKGRKF